MTLESGSDWDQSVWMGDLPGPIAVVGPGRLGSVLSRALVETGFAVTGPHGRGFTGQDSSIVVLCVPDAAISVAAEAIVQGPLVAHCSGATNLAALSPHRGFSIHPVMTFSEDAEPNTFHGVNAAVAATDPDALVIARGIARCLGLRPFDVADENRVAYHAAAAMAANFFITLLEAAAELIRTAQVDPRVVLPLARAALENWDRQGSAALTGPIARGDHAVVQAHRDAVAERAAHLLPMFDALAAATAELGLVRPNDRAGDRR
jgi:predicted short-subunit dehydrogenase-like oxidoreductase (DUF2520 family)